MLKLIYFNSQNFPHSSFIPGLYSHAHSLWMNTNVFLPVSCSLDSSTRQCFSRDLLWKHDAPYQDFGDFGKTQYSPPGEPLSHFNSSASLFVHLFLNSVSSIMVGMFCRLNVSSRPCTVLCLIEVINKIVNLTNLSLFITLKIYYLTLI